MAGLNAGLELGLGLPALAIHMASVALARALRTYSRSRLEEVCERRGRVARADAIAHLDERTERAAEALEVLSGLVLAALLGAAASALPSRSVAGPIVLGVLMAGALGHVLAAAVGRAQAEILIDRLWPVTGPLRRLTMPLTGASRLLEAWFERLADRPDASPRPSSVEVEIHHHADDDPGDDLEAELPEVTREILERAVELARRDVAELMVPRSAIVDLPATVSAEVAARAFHETGRSRVPLFGESRDDIVGILYLKDLMAALLDAEAAGGPPPSPRKLCRPAYCIPETKSAIELLEEFRTRRTHLAMALDEYGGVAGLITIEDLLEQLVGPIDDEHDAATHDPVIELGDGRFDVDASTLLEALNDRIGLRLPTNGDFQTVGGFAFNTLGHLPDPGDSFRHGGVKFTIAEVGGRSIRRLHLDTRPEEVSLAGRPAD